MHHLALRHVEADADHRVLEELAVLGLADHVRLRGEQDDAVLREHAAPLELEGDVEPRLPAHGREQRVGLLLRDDLLDGVGRDRLDVRPVGDVRVGHDRRGVAVHQDDLVPLLAERLAGLRPRVVELGRLADHDRAGAEEEDATDVGALGHAAGGPSTRGERREGRRVARR